MTDTVSPEVRSRIMAQVKSKGMKPEMQVRRLLHGLGYRYRLHRKDLPGRPDLVFSSRRKVVFVNGCFWHKHSGLSTGVAVAAVTMPAMRPLAWRAAERVTLGIQVSGKVRDRLEVGAAIGESGALPYTLASERVQATLRVATPAGHLPAHQAGRPRCPVVTRPVENVDARNCMNRDCRTRIS